MKVMIFPLHDAKSLASTGGPMKFVQLLQAVIILAIFSPPVADSSTFSVLVLDALDGKPQPGVAVCYLCDEIPHSTNTEAITNAAVIAEVPYTCKPGTKIELDAIPPVFASHHKEGCGGVAATAEEIKLTGVVSHPDSEGGINGGMWCPTKISRRLTPVPGQVTLFVKKPTWYQSQVVG
jgi:hypothetical protein